jgi:hypothetical protein
MDAGNGTVQQLSRFVTAALLAGSAWILEAGIQATNPTFTDVLDSPIDYLNVIAFTIALVATAIAAVGLYRTGFVGRIPAALVAIGYSLLAFGVAVGILLGESPEWFWVVGLPGNLMALIGMVWLGISIMRRKTLPVWVGVLAIAGGLFAVVMAEFGTSVIAGVFWLYIGSRFLEQERPRLSLS